MVEPLIILMAHSYWFIIGREPELSYAEIRAVLPATELTYLPPIVKTGPVTLSPQLINRLGGTVKITQELEEKLEFQALETIITTHASQQSSKIIFGLSSYAPEGKKTLSITELTNLGKRIKKNLQDQGRSVRFIPNRESSLSSVTVEKNGLTRRGAEFVIFHNGTHFSLAKTITVQPFEALSTRDFGRPGRDDKSGMLPPKLALMLLNFSQTQPDETILDPFCGSGTILTEAMLLGYTNLVGSDISERAIADTRQNIAWTEKNLLPTPRTCRTFVENVTELTRQVPPESINAIVTEPFLGKPLTGRESPAVLKTQLNELTSIFRSALSVFQRLLQPGGRVVIVVPRYQAHTTWLTLPFAHLAQEAGFSIEPLLDAEKTLVYARAKQHVGREIWRLRKS